MKYFYNITDKNGYVHSIDNCILVYSMKYINSLTDLLLYLENLKSIHNLDNEYWTRNNLPACSHYSFFSDIVHLCNGIYLSIGKYNYIKDKKDPFIVPLVKLEINLNKHFDKTIFSDLNDWLIKNSGDISLIKYDYAIDIKAPVESIQNIGSRKERGLYKGTRYYGQRNKHGYCKIYDKKKEQELDYDLTRIEHTFISGEKLSLEPIYIKSNKKIDEKLNDTDRCILKMLGSLKAYGEDITVYLNDLGRRKKKTILDNLQGYEYKKLEYNQDILKNLLDKVKQVTKYTDKEKVIFEDKDGFLKIADNEQIPFN